MKINGRSPVVVLVLSGNRNYAPQRLIKAIEDIASVFIHLVDVNLSPSESSAQAITELVERFRAK